VDPGLRRAGCLPAVRPQRFWKGLIYFDDLCTTACYLPQITVHLLCHDLSFVIGAEELYWNDPPIVAKSQSGIANLSEDELHLLDKIAIFLKESDFHLTELADIQKQTPFLHYDK